MLEAPEELIEVIRFQGICAEISFPTFSEDSDDFDIILRIAFTVFESYFEKGKPSYARPILAEAIMNAAEHGNQWNRNKKISVGIWIGEKGVLFGIKDEGDFFRQESTQQTIKRRKRFPSTAKERRGGFGMLEIYHAHDIQLRDGVLFFTVLLREKTKGS